MAKTIDSMHEEKKILSQQTPDKILNHNLCFFNLSGEYKGFKNMEEGGCMQGN